MTYHDLFVFPINVFKNAPNILFSLEFFENLFVFLWVCIFFLNTKQEMNQLANVLVFSK